MEHQLFVLDTFASLMPEVDHDDHHHGHNDDDDSYDDDDDDDDDDEIQILGASLPDPRQPRGFPSKCFSYRCSRELHCLWCLVV